MGVNPTLGAALANLELGLSVVAINTNPRVRNGKAPVGSWDEYQEHPPSADTVRGWFSNDLGWGLGIVTDQVSRLLVCDIDLYKPKGPASFAMLVAHGMDPEHTYAVCTQKGGLHAYYRLREGERFASVRSRDVLPDVEIQGDGAQVLAPPTLGYEAISLEEIAPLPDTLRAFLAGLRDARTTASNGQAKASTNGQPPQGAPRSPDHWLDGRGCKYGLAAVDREVAALSGMAVDSGRNIALNNAGLKLYELVAGGCLDARYVEGQLIGASYANRYIETDGMQAAVATIESGRKAGLAQPRTCGAGEAAEPADDAHADADDDGGAVGDGVPYEESAAGLVHVSRTKSKNGAWSTNRIPLSNFTARIIEDRVEDDGQDRQRVFAIEGRLRGRVHRFDVAADHFSTMNWPVKAMGASASISPGMGAKDRVRHAIQVLSRAQEREVFTYTGWREIDGVDVYLHAGGAIGRDGLTDGLEVRLPTELAPLVLPDPEGDLSAAVTASLRLLDLEPRPVSAVLLAATYTAVLSSLSATPHLYGGTGEGKTERAALAQQHFGAGFDAQHLPLSWSSTRNALERSLFTAKDALLVVDELVLTESNRKVLLNTVDGVLRSLANRQGRGRMRADLSTARTFIPRGAALSTGEELPSGQSANARAITLEVPSGVTDWSMMTELQRDARSGLFAQSMAGWIRYLARNPELRERFREDVLDERSRIQTLHPRTSTAAAELIMGGRYLSWYAGSVGVDDVDAVAEGIRADILEVAGAQEQYQRAHDPVERFLVLFESAITQGRAHVAAVNGETPSNWRRWGWRQSERGQDDDYHPMGDQIGWVDRDGLFLDPEAAYAAASRVAQGQQEVVGASRETLGRRLNARGLLLTTTPGRSTVRKVIGTQRPRVWHLAVEEEEAE